MVFSLKVSLHFIFNYLRIALALIEFEQVQYLMYTVQTTKLNFIITQTYGIVHAEKYYINAQNKQKTFDTYILML